jgi:Aspartyl/Asparaginyl beta-hydroxylase
LSSIKLLAEKCNQISWAQQQYTRGEPPLKEGGLIVLPYVIKPQNYQVSSEQQELIDLCAPIVDKLALLFPRARFIRGEIATLPPGVELGWHVDPMWFHEHCNRIHVPIITDNSCVQLWQGYQHHLSVGKIYEINNRARHSARNPSSIYRTHLIFDLCDIEKWNKFIHSGGNPNSMTCDPEL